MTLVHQYRLSLNEGQAVAEPIIASYGAVHRIFLHMQPTGILIEVITGAEKNSDSILFGTDDLFADAIRKSLVLYIIRYGRVLDVTQASVFINGKECRTYKRTLDATPLVYTMASGELRIGFPECWHSRSLETIIAHTPKSSFDGRFNALYSLIVAKSNRYESERLIYYWMAMNALYNYTGSLLKGSMGDAQYREFMRRDADKQAEFLRHYCYDPFKTGNNRKERDKYDPRARDESLSVLKSIPHEDIEAFCISCLAGNTANHHVSEVLSVIRKHGHGIDPSHAERFIFPFMVVWLPYKVRCDLFHASKCLPTICFRHDEEINAIRVINHLLDQFLSSELLKWFITDQRSDNC